MLGPATCSRLGVYVQIARAFRRRQHLACPRHAFGSERAASRFSQFGFFLNMHFSKTRLVRALPSVTLALLSVFATGPVCAQVTIPEEYDKLINRREVSAFGNEGFGDQIDLAGGSLQIVQTDIDLPGNNALPVRVSRRFQAADTYGGGHFRYWSLDIPNVHGTFPHVGWVVDGPSGATSQRCTYHGAPPDLYWNDAWWSPNEYWHGTFFSLPGGNDQELLQINGGAHVPSDGHSYHAITKSGAAARCVALDPTSEILQGEGFEIVSPDGTVYTLNHMVRRYRGALIKSTSSPILGASEPSTAEPSKSETSYETQSPTGYNLSRDDYILFPTVVKDRFGNTVTYVWSTTNPWQLLQIVASDGRQLTFSYNSAANSTWVTSVSDGTRTWQYAYAAANGFTDDADTLTLPDGSAWRYSLARLFRMPLKPTSTFCATMNTLTQRTSWDSGSSTHYPGSITSPSGATVTYNLAAVMLGRSYLTFNCVSESGDPALGRPNDPYLFLAAAPVSKQITGPGLPPGGMTWSYSYGPSNNCWIGSYSEGIACTGSSPTTRQVIATEPDGSQTRYTYGNRANVDEGLLYKTEYGFTGTTALRTTDITYAAAGAAPYGAYDGWSPRGSGDFELTSKMRPQRQVTTIQQGRTFTWQVATGCNGNPYCFDAFARPTKVNKSSSP